MSDNTAPPRSSQAPAAAGFQEAGLAATPIRDLKLAIAGSALEPVLSEFQREVEHLGLTKLHPRFYLSTEWGVPEGTVAIAIPFYLARPELTALHAERAGHVEGVSRADILRYLRHELGHVVNYAYRLYETPEWKKLFGAMDEPYLEDFRPEPFSRRFVRHLPGWYAQKHPDEDWAETFAVWMTPGRNWRADYAGWPVALAKLEYCDRTLASLAEVEPVVTGAELDEDVGELGYSVEQFYRALSPRGEAFPAELDDALRAIFEDYGGPEHAAAGSARRRASGLIRRTERDLTDAIYRWTGHFPERTRPLLRYLADRGDQLDQVYPAEDETHVLLSLAVLVATLATNQVQRGSYVV